jgi:hypothetical protein
MPTIIPSILEIKIVCSGNTAVGNYDTDGYDDYNDDNE